MRTLSTKWTIFYKFILPVVFLGPFSINSICSLHQLGLLLASESGRVDLGLILLFFLSCLLLFWNPMRSKVVKLDGERLIVSNYFRRETVIPLRDVDRVSGSILISPEFVSIHLRTPSAFGSKIVFLPQSRFFQGFNRHPVVAELRALVEAARLAPLG